jgi:hypothetical protein
MLSFIRFLGLAASISFAVPAMAQSGVNHEKEYQACIRLAQTNPAKAAPAAEYWAKKGGGKALSCGGTGRHSPAGKGRSAV